MPARPFTIVGLGEALFDVLPQGLVLGGAPLNVAMHAHQLGSPVGGKGIVLSRVGQDELGNRLLDELRSHHMDVGYVQTDPDHPTGRVYVSFDQNNQPSYDIVTGSAWDNLQFDPDVEDLARRCDAVCFGSLAQRSSNSRDTILRFLYEARRAVRLFDVNLRQDYYNQTILRRSCESATVVKLNAEELPVVIRTLGLNTTSDDSDRLAEGLRRTFDLKMVVLTRGEKGTTLYVSNRKIEGEAVSYSPADNADPVGAGDACSAGLLVGLALGLPLEKTLTLANHMGAYVASQSGATPKLPESIVKMVT